MSNEVYTFRDGGLVPGDNVIVSSRIIDTTNIILGSMGVPPIQNPDWGGFESDEVADWIGWAVYDPVTANLYRNEMRESVGILPFDLSGLCQQCDLVFPHPPHEIEETVFCRGVQGRQTVIEYDRCDQCRGGHQPHCAGRSTISYMWKTPRWRVFVEKVDSLSMLDAVFSSSEDARLAAENVWKADQGQRMITVIKYGGE